MDIFLLFVFNIFTGAVIFLILSLKIEKTSSTFQEKKLRKEMGEIITEFNSTAERNITLLENRISVLKKLLNENGSLKGIDFTVLDSNMKNNNTKSNQSVSIDKTIPDNKEYKNKKIEDEVNTRQINEEHDIIGSFMDKIQSFNKDEESQASKLRINKSKDTKKEIINSGNSFSIIEKDIKDLHLKKNQIDLTADEEITLTYESPKPVDLEELFHQADDKYVLIARLYSEGHSVEDLSKYSGIPAGEIKLVISLNS